MSKKRTAIKYSAALALTGIYAGATYKAWSDLGEDRPPYDFAMVKKIAATSAVLASVTWTIALI